MDGFIVEESAVGIFSVIAKRFAMVGHHGDQRVVEEAASAKLGQQLSYDGIGIGDLAVVGGRFVVGLVRFGRIVGVVRIVQVDPDEKWSARLIRRWVS